MFCSVFVNTVLTEHFANFNLLFTVGLIGWVENNVRHSNALESLRAQKAWQGFDGSFISQTAVGLGALAFVRKESMTGEIPLFA